MAADVVVFRKWLDCGDIIALFPEHPADINGWLCDAYEHVGQHGGADYHGVIQRTRPAEADEYASLADELQRIGYALRPVRRTSWRHHAKRRRAARQLAGDTG